MVVAIDKITAVRMYDKVKAAWAKRRAELAVLPYNDKKLLEEQAATVAFMDKTDMAVVVSSAQNEVETFKKKGLDIAPHRQRMIKEDLDTRFKDDKEPLRIVFVCAMWMTGFDVPSCGAIYLDKPMKNHTLMQTIARANRVYEGRSMASSSTTSASSGTCKRPSPSMEQAEKERVRATRLCSRKRSRSRISPRRSSRRRRTSKPTGRPPRNQERKRDHPSDSATRRRR